MFWNILVELCNERNTSPTAVVRELGIANGNVTRWKKGSLPRDTNLKKVADYFGVSVDYLSGKEEEKEKSPEVTGEKELKIALFGGDGEVTDEMWDDVKKYAEFIKTKYKK